jgi:hypothetical protein
MPDWLRSGSLATMRVTERCWRGSEPSFPNLSRFEPREARASLPTALHGDRKEGLLQLAENPRLSECDLLYVLSRRHRPVQSPWACVCAA